MTLHISVISIQGDARQELGEFFGKRGYRIMPRPECVSDLDGLSKYLLYIEDKAITYTHGRTNIIDPEMVLMVDEEMLALFSRQFGSVITMICEGVSGSYGYSVYLDGDMLREVLVIDGEIKIIGGNTLTEEFGINLSSLYEVKVIEILAKLGFNFYNLDKANSYRILENIEVSREAKHESTPARNPYLDLLRSSKNPSKALVPEKPKNKKPWWKFWQ